MAAAAASDGKGNRKGRFGGFGGDPCRCQMAAGKGDAPYGRGIADAGWIEADGNPRIHGGIGIRGGGSDCGRKEGRGGQPCG